MYHVIDYFCCLLSNDIINMKPDTTQHFIMHSTDARNKNETKIADITTSMTQQCLRHVLTDSMDTLALAGVTNTRL